jgi:hypothetical protein
MVYGAQLSGIPMKVWFSEDDTSVRPVDVANFAALTGAATKSLGSVGHSAGGLTWASLDLFLNQYRTG